MTPDYARAALIYQLRKDYHAITPDLKWLRKEPHSGERWEMDGQREESRSRASGWFGAVLTLYRSGLLTTADMQIVASPAAARLFVDHVAPLDAAVRVAAHGAEDANYVHPSVAFWTALADGQLLVFPQERAQ